MRKFKKYILPSIGIVLVSVVGSLFTNSGMDWFKMLNKPSEWIPSFVIPVMWTIIYLLYWIFMISNDYYLYPMITNLLVFNGFLNVVWCFIYFVINSLLGGVVVIIFNLIASIFLVIEIKKVYKVWGSILFIYPLWLSIATILNVTTFILN